MRIWVDADACPVVIKDILFRAAERRGIEMTLVANQPLRVPPSKFISSLQVSAGFDVADSEIAQRTNAGDLVITSDIHLASLVLEKGGFALSPRGEKYSPDSIKSRLNMRDFMETLRASGINSGGPPPLNQQDRKNFADHLDRVLSRHGRPA